MRVEKQERLIRIAAVMGLVGLVAMAWSVLDPRPIPVFLSMTAGQVVGTGSLALFLFAMIRGIPERQK